MRARERGRRRRGRLTNGAQGLGVKQGRRLETFSGYETGCARCDRLFLVRPTLEYIGNANLVDRESVLMPALGRG